MKDSGILSTLDRGLAVLTAFTPAQPEWGVVELANHLQTHKTTIHKTLATFMRWGMIQQDPVTKRYRLGLRIVDLAQAVSYRQAMAAAARPYLEQLASLTRDTVRLTVPFGQEAFCIESIEGAGERPTQGQIGLAGPLHSGATGKVLLAHFPRPLAERILAERAPADHLSRTNPETFWRELEEIVKSGHAISTAEVHKGTFGISAPVRDGTGKVIASVTVSGLSFNLTPERQPELIAQVRTFAAQISRRLGHLA